MVVVMRFAGSSILSFSNKFFHCGWCFSCCCSIRFCISSRSCVAWDNYALRFLKVWLSLMWPYVTGSLQKLVHPFEGSYIAIVRKLRVWLVLLLGVDLIMLLIFYSWVLWDSMSPWNAFKCAEIWCRNSDMVLRSLVVDIWSRCSGMVATSVL